MFNSENKGMFVFDNIQSFCYAKIGFFHPGYSMNNISLMAEKLLRRYPARTRLWRMTERDYFQAAPSTFLDEARLRKLTSIKLPELESIAKVIAGKKLAAYEEGILELLAQDLKGFAQT